MVKTDLPYKIYLAGDTVFWPDALERFGKMKAICREYGLHGVAPFDGQADVQDSSPGFETSMKIAAMDRSLMNECDAGVFCINPYRRAADMDPGTAVELGYMAAQGKPLAGYTDDGRLYTEKVKDYRATAWKDELVLRTAKGGSGSFEDADGILVHSEGMYQNIMVEGFIRMSGSSVFVSKDSMDAFRMAIADLKRLLSGHSQASK
ncbi:nucleoside 2-deoxyribosyltransferase [Schizosaccharomyces japonicus yFS275]|uniref:Nucleoside 2-deoxyribosyltransferase n=1 Tax=Schizosaccharomyces japonicus (strain yFS275 / FY16936) TaxID=402676 RepID=B6JZE0_SCHJY|nr:nucleoside 2-deoxyribosyltransferase [Schizosaccharomyces japonicus yFS275]EEB06908.1 nucleoside 2-deoxyribosyltransferase [Schizosaccharomyces japonicus yFS275]